MTTHAPPTQLTRSDYRTLGLSALGGALEFYDFIIFYFFREGAGRAVLSARHSGVDAATADIRHLAAGY